jgi:hypothetical protein
LRYVSIQESPILSEFNAVVPLEKVPPVVDKFYRLVFVIVVIIGMI